MGRISDPDCQKLADEWSLFVIAALDDLGRKTWPSFTVKRGLLAKPQEITPYSLDGPVQTGGQVCWAVAHIRRPSAFSSSGALSSGEREFWLIKINPGSPPALTVEGADIISTPLLAESDLQIALNQAA